MALRKKPLSHLLYCTVKYFFSLFIIILLGGLFSWKRKKKRLLDAKNFHHPISLFHFSSSSFFSFFLLKDLLLIHFSRAFISSAADLCALLYLYRLSAQAGSSASTTYPIVYTHWDCIHNSVDAHIYLNFMHKKKRDHHLVYGLDRLYDPSRKESCAQSF